MGMSPMGVGKYFKLIALAALTAGLAAGPARAADLIIDSSSGYLTGANNILVNGGLYNMRLRDGTCAALYGGCTDPAADFTFSTAAAASAASEALFTEVFPNFDDISKMRGLGAADYAGVYTPYGLAGGGPDLQTYENYFEFHTFSHIFKVQQALLSSASDLSSDTHEVYAVWQAEPLLATPLPPSAILFGTALLGLVVLKKRKSA